MTRGGRDSGIKVGQFDNQIELAAQGKNSRGKLFTDKRQRTDAKLEAEVATALREELVSFQRSVFRPKNDPETGPFTEIDIELPDFIIEVTSGKGGKVPQVRDRLLSSIANPNQKPVIVFAPKFKAAAQSTLDAGAFAVVKSLDELNALLRRSRGNQL